MSVKEIVLQKFPNYEFLGLNLNDCTVLVLVKKGSCEIQNIMEVLRRYKGQGVYAAAVFVDDPETSVRAITVEG